VVDEPGDVMLCAHLSLAPARWRAADVVTIRLWQAGDEPALAALANNRKVWRNLTNRFPHPYTLDDAYAWVAAANAMPLYLTNYCILVK